MRFARTAIQQAASRHEPEQLRMRTVLDLKPGTEPRIWLPAPSGRPARHAVCSNGRPPLWSSYVTQSRLSVTRASAEKRSTSHAAPRKAEYTSEVRHLQQLVSSLQQKGSLQEKITIILKNKRTQSFLRANKQLKGLLGLMSPPQALMILALPAMQQSHVLAKLPADNEEVLAALQKLADTLLKADEFYDSLGGIIGYQAKCLELISHQGSSTSPGNNEDVKFHRPQGPDLDGLSGQHIAAVEAAKGLEALPHMAEIWPLGGAGDRLGLKCDMTGKSVPTAMLPYCGRTLLEGLVRDLQARENLYFKMYGVQCVTPVVIMTSEAKKNHPRILRLLQSFNYFGRGKESFRVICQPMVPVVSAQTGKWVLPEACSPLMKPGGHGAVWKLMLDRGVFDWLSSLHCEAALVRQISNPIAGTDATMLALTGSGYVDGRTFGFASCDRRVGATEGMNVLMQRRLPLPNGGSEYAYNVTNVEYTEFERLGISDEQAEDSSRSLMPANTNILYVNLKAAEAAVKAGVVAGGGAALPGMIFNGKKTISWTDHVTGKEHCEPAGRMECTMQNLVDSLAQRFQEPIPLEHHAGLKTFAVFNKRRRVTSSAKRKRVPDSTVISQTPDGSFLDLMENSREVLQRCGYTTPEVGSVENFLKAGPGFIFLFHPSLGPLWDIIAQKLRGGALAPGSELVLEVAEASIIDLRLDGSFLVEGDAVYGQNPATDQHSAKLSLITSQAVSYPETGSEAMQYSGEVPDIARASSMVVPLHRKRPLFTAPGVERTREGSSKSPGSVGHDRLVFNSQCARIRLNGVVIKNKGIDWQDEDNIYWQHKVSRREQVKVILHGQSEFEASHVVLLGSHTFEIPDGYKMVVSSAPGGGIRRSLYPLPGRRPSWQWRCLSGPEGVIQMKMEDPISPLPGVPLAIRPTETEVPFTYMI